MSQTKRKLPESSGPTGGLKLAEFARQLGSTSGVDPIPPDQYLAYMDARYSPEVRLWAWMLAHTIRFDYRKPYAVDAHGNKLRLEDAARELRTADDKPMDAGNVRRAWRHLEAETRVKRDRKDGSLWLCGEVTLPEEKGEEKEIEVCTDLFPPYIRKQIAKLPPERRKELTAAYRTEHASQKLVQADAVAAVRTIYDTRKDYLLSQYGVKQIREDHHQNTLALVDPAEQDAAKQYRAAVRESIAKVVAFFAERSVQTFQGSVQMPEAPLYKPQEPQRTDRAVGAAAGVGSPVVKGLHASGTARASSESRVQREAYTSASISADTRRATTTPSHTSSNDEDARHLSETLSQYCTPDAAGIKNLILNCRTLAPDVTVDEICYFVHQKGQNASRKLNPFGVLLVAVPSACQGPALAQLRKQREHDRARAAEAPAANLDAEAQAARDRYEYLRAHPTECEHCGGVGTFKHHAAKRPVACTCPAGSPNRFQEVAG